MVDELKAINGKMDRLINILESGKLQVQPVERSEAIPGLRSAGRGRRLHSAEVRVAFAPDPAQPQRRARVDQVLADASDGDEQEGCRRDRERAQGKPLGPGGTQARVRRRSADLVHPRASRSASVAARRCSVL